MSGCFRQVATNKVAFKAGLTVVEDVTVVISL